MNLLFVVQTRRHQSIVRVEITDRITNKDDVLNTAVKEFCACLVEEEKADFNCHEQTKVFVKTLSSHMSHWNEVGVMAESAIFEVGARG